MSNELEKRRSKPKKSKPLRRRLRGSLGKIIAGLGDGTRAYAGEHGADFQKRLHDLGEWLGGDGTGEAGASESIAWLGLRERSDFVLELSNLTSHVVTPNGWGHVFAGVVPRADEVLRLVAGELEPHKPWRATITHAEGHLDALRGAINRLYGAGKNGINELGDSVVEQPLRDARTELQQLMTTLAKLIDACDAYAEGEFEWPDAEE